jgi:pyocin large subunit-like protein
VKSLSSSQHSILNILAFRANDVHEAWPSIKSLSESSSLDRKTVIKVIQSLIDKNLINNTGKKAGKTKRVPVYKLNLNSPKSGTVQNLNSPNISGNSPNIGTVKQSQNWDMERSSFKDQRKEGFSETGSPKPLKDLLAKLRFPDKPC